MDGTSARQLPAGTVTLLFTDIEGSTRLLHEIGELYGDVLADHHRLLREVWAAHGGVEVDTEGDAFFVAFPDARSALRAAAAAQEELGVHPWPHGGPVRVRMGVHTGAPQIRDGTYWGVDVHYAARLCSAAHGGQVLVSASTRALADDVAAEDLGEHAVKDFPVARRLYHLTVAGRTSADFPPPRTLETVQTNLPSIASRLVGRERELEALREQLAGGARLLTLTGVGGSGKTRLALACGMELLASFADGVFLVSLASLGADEQVAPAIARAVGATVEDGRDPEPALIDHLARRELLVIVDNVEHLIGAGPLLARLVEAAPGLRILATSQAPLRVRGETVMPLESLEVPMPGEVDPAVLAGVPAVALFAERARSADPGFALTAQDAPVVAELCRRLDGMPLALELAAARVRLSGPTRLLAALERGVDALGTGARDLPERQRGLRAALDWTVSLLGDDERALFAGLGAFAEAWTLEQVERMFGAELDVWEASASLLDFSLIRARGDGRFTMAETVRAYARALLAEHGRADDCRARHAVMLAEEAEAIYDEVYLDTGALVAGTIELLPEFAAALAWSAERAPETHRRLVGALGMPYYLAGHLSAVADDLARLAGAGDAGDAVFARLLHGVAAVLVSRADLAGAADAAARSAASWRRLGDQRGEAMALVTAAHMLGFARVEEDVERARELLDAAGALPAVRADRRLEDLIGVEVAINRFAAGAIDDAEALLAEVEADAGRTDFFSQFAGSYLADCAVIRGEYDEALPRYAEILRRMRGTQLHNVLLQCHCMATALAGLGRDREAVELIEATQAVGEREGIDLPDELSIAPQLLAGARARLGQEACAQARRRGRERERDVDDIVSWALSLPASVAAG
jgi:predicted ATPase/class 3 adenylate cyclase